MKSTTRTELVGNLRAGDIIKLHVIPLKVIEVVAGPTDSWACRDHGYYIRAALVENPKDITFYGPYPDAHVVTFA